MKISKKDIVSSLICGEIASWFLIFIVKKTPEAGDIGQSIWLWSLIIVLPIAFALGIWIADIFARFLKILYQLAKFIEVGLLNTVIDSGVLSVLMVFSGVSSGGLYSFFKALSFIVSATNSYLWNKLWTFQKREFQKASKEYLQFLVVSGIGFGINVAVASLVVNVIGPQFGLSNFLWGIVGAVSAGIIGLAWNFLGYKFIVFKK